MNTQNITYDPHQPAFLPFKNQDNLKKSKKESAKTPINYHLWISRVLTLVFIIGSFYLLSLVLTENVMKVLGVIFSLTIIRWIVKLILKITFTIISIAIILIIIAVITLAIL